LLDELADDVVERLERVGVDADIPIAVRHDVVAGAGLRLGGGGELVLLALPGDVIDPHLDAVLRAPFAAKRRRRFVGSRHPMIPHAKRQYPGGAATANMRCGNGRDGADGGRTKNRSTRKA
jgi:hypothetical protein